MAAPQQHALTNTSCTFSTSPATFSSTAGSYGSAQSAFCGDLHGRVTVPNDRDVPSVVYSSAAVVPQPILAHSASRKTKPCSLCGTAALRSQSSLVPNSPISPQEQPVVLLHRLEDGLPEGDVDSLRAFGTIRLLPVHRHCGKVEALTDDSTHECDRKYQSATSHTMAPGNVAYKSFKRGNIKKRTELPAGSRSYGDLTKSLTNEILRKYAASDDHLSLGEKLSEQTLKGNTNIAKPEVDCGGTSHRATKRTESPVCNNSEGGRLDSREEALGTRFRTVPSHHNYPSQYSTASSGLSVRSGSHSSHRVSNPQHQTLSSPQAETLDHSATDGSLLSLNYLSPQTRTSSSTIIHSYGSASQPGSIQDAIHQRSSSPDTPMSVVCSPVVPLTTTTLSSPSQNLGSPSAISPSEFLPSPPSPLSPPFVCSSSTCDRENLQSSCSADIRQSSSPYSPCTLPSLPASPTSLPSSSDSVPSPTPSIDSPPASPATSSGQQRKISHNQVPRPCFERLGGDPHSDVTNSAAQLDTVHELEVDPERSRLRGSEVVPLYHLNQVSSMENAEKLSDKSYNCRKEGTQVPSACQTTRAPSAQIHLLEDYSTASQNSETEAQADSCVETSVDRECVEGEGSVAEVGHFKSDLAKCDLNSESKSVEAEKNCSDSRNSSMKLVLKVKHSGNQQLPLGSEKKEYNKENGIPKIVLTLRGNGPNKEYSCSNRLRNESESCSGESVNNKKHKSKRNKRQKPKDREKTKKIMKGGKHKRHVELFGEDSNDSCDIIPDNFKDNPSGGRHSRTPSTDNQEPGPSLAPCTREESSSVHGENYCTPTLSLSESPSDCAKDGGNGETMDSPPSPVDESLPHSLLSLSDASDINTSFGGRTVDRSSVESEEANAGQTKRTENNTHEASKLTVEAPETWDSDPPCTESKQEDETSRASPSILQCNEISHQEKKPESLTVRSRRSRHAKNTESGRNSDACLWVSFGVNAPVPLPATDLPSLGPVFTCKEKTRPKESEINESKEDSAPSQPPVGDGEKPVPKTTRKEWRASGKTEAVSNVITECLKQDYAGKGKLPPVEYSDCKIDPSYSRCKVNSSSSHEDSNDAHARSRSHSDTTHRARHSHKRLRKSDDYQEEAVKKEPDPCQHNSSDITKRDDGESQELITNKYQEKSSTSDLTPVCAVNSVEMETKEKSASKEASGLPDISLRVGGNKGSHKDPSSYISQPEGNVTANEQTFKPERPVNLENEEVPDDQYYRPKKIRRALYNKITTEHWNEKKFLDQREGLEVQVRRKEEEGSISPKDGVSLKSSSPEAFTTTTSSSAMHVAESEPSRVGCDTSEIKTDAHWKPHVEISRRDVQPKNPQDSETSNEQKKCLYRSPTPQGQESLDEQSKHDVERVKEESTEKQEGVGQECSPGSQDNEKQETSKKEKEKRKKSRREKRKENSGPGSRCSVLQEAQFRREVEHEEGRGRRLAQEIKGFNWLEQKIKNSSLLSSHSAPSTPSVSPSAKESEPTFRGLSTATTPNSTPSTQFSFGNKEEEHARKNSFTGNGCSIGLKRHLQTAVPPLVPSSKVTALPKRRQSLSTPTTPPCSGSSALCSVPSTPSMTVRDTLYTCEPIHYKSGHGRTGPTLENNTTDLGNEHTESDKATLYSSTSSTKATLYGVKANTFEALYDTVSASAVNCYGSADSGNIDTQYNITTSPAICFYGSTKYQEPGAQPDKISSTGSHANSSVISTSRDSSVMTDQQLDTLHSSKSNTCSSRNADWSTRQGSIPNSNSQHFGYSTDTQSPQRFSHKQALLRRAFQEMLKSDPNNSSTEQIKEKLCVLENIPIDTEMNKADGSKCFETETTCFASSQSSPERTSPVEITVLKSKSSDSTPSLLSNKSLSVTTDNCIFSYSQESVAESVKSEKKIIDPLCTGNKIPTLSTEISEDAESVTCKLDSDNKIVKSERDPNIKENCSDMETSVQKVNDNRNITVTENSKDLQSNVIDCIVSASSDIDMKVLKDEICHKGDGKNKEDAEVQPSLLLSVLYKELMKTRQEVEKLRKVQELMLTEKEEKKDDTIEQNSEHKVEYEKAEENFHSNETILEKRKDHEVRDDTELTIDYDECHYHEDKRLKISIRNDLLPSEDSVAVDTTSSDISATQNNVSHAHQSSSPAPTNPSLVKSSLEDSVTTLEGSAVPNTSHPSRTSPVIPAVSPGLSNTTSVASKIISLPVGHVRTSPRVSSPGVSRASPGIPKLSPTITRTSPGTPISNNGSTIASPGTSVSLAMPSSSPGITRNSPGVPRSSPGVLRMSPGLPRTNSGIPRSSPGAPMASPGSSRNGLGLMRNGSEVPSINPGIPQMSPTSTQVIIFNPPTNPSSTDNLQISYSYSAVTTVQPKMTTVQSITSPVVPAPRFPQIPITSTVVPTISPTGGKTNCPVSRISPSISKIDTTAAAPLNKTGTPATNMSPTKLRSVFGISNSEVELMPVSIGAKQPLHEPQPQTFLNLGEDQHHRTTEASLLNAVQGVHQGSGAKNVESSSHGSVPFHNLGCHEDPKRISKMHQYMGEMKRHAFSTSDLPDHGSPTCKQPPPLKPVSALVRRHSDNMDIHSVMHHQAMYPGTHKNLSGSLHSSTSAAELKNPNSVHPLNQPQYSPTQYPLPNPSRRRSSEGNSSERNRGYHQAVSIGMPHQYSHLTPGSSVMRSLGPDKATIFPIPPAVHTAIRPFRPSTSSSLTRAQLEQFQNENFYRSNFSFFEKIREKFAHPCDNGVSPMDRLQSPTANVEKPLQPQTFAPRVLVRESVPESPSHIPTTTFTTLHFPNQNQPPPNALPSHQNHFTTNMHSGSSIHHMAQARLHTSTNQATSSIQCNSSSGRSGEKLCLHCPQQARFICSGCKKAWYCSEQCQREHWSIHSAACVL